MPRTFVSWVEPLAKRFREDKDEVVRFAREAPAQAWDKPSAIDGWSCKDLLAHLASNDDIRYILHSVIEKTPLDASRLVIGGAAQLNADNVAERRGRSVEELIAELEAHEEETQELLAELTGEDGERRQGDLPMSLGEGLASDALLGHYQEHLAQMRKAAAS